MPTIDLTPENRPLIDAVMRLAATSWPQRDEAAEDELVKAILELVAWRKVGQQVAKAGPETFNASEYLCCHYCGVSMEGGDHAHISGCVWPQVEALLGKETPDAP